MEASKESEDDSSKLPRRITIRDVARFSGKSTSTVSVALSGREGVSDETRRTIIDMANRLGWRPNRRASLLRRSDPHLVGLVYEVEQTFQARLVDALYFSAQKRGLELTLAGATAHHDETAATTESLRDRCQALILTGSGLSDEKVGKLAEQIPVLSIGRPIFAPRVDSVVCDNVMGLRQAVEHLRSFGHRDIACIDGGEKYALSVLRREAFEQAYKEFSPQETARVFPGGTDLFSGVQAARVIANIHPRPTAVTVYNDVCAAGFTRELRALGIRVPGDISVVGFDDGPEASDPSTLLTTVRQDPAPLAEKSMELILKRVSADRLVAPGDEEQEFLPTRLIVRTSTGPVNTSL